MRKIRLAKRIAALALVLAMVSVTFADIPRWSAGPTTVTAQGQSGSAGVSNVNIPPPPDGAVFSIIDIVADRAANSIAVEIMADAPAILTVDIHTDVVGYAVDWLVGPRVGGGTVSIGAEMHGHVEVPISIALPEYFTVHVRLLDSRGNDLSDPQIFIWYTDWYINEFSAMTIHDFASDRVIDLIDEQDDMNFLVVAEDIAIVDATTPGAVAFMPFGFGDRIEVENFLASVDEDTNTYVFENPCEELSSLRRGDRAVIVTDCGDIHLLHVNQLSATGDELRIRAFDEEEYYLGDFFEFVRLELRAPVQQAVTQHAAISPAFIAPPNVSIGPGSERVVPDTCEAPQCSFRFEADLPDAARVRLFGIDNRCTSGCDCRTTTSCDCDPCSRCWTRTFGDSPNNVDVRLQVDYSAELFLTVRVEFSLIRRRVLGVNVPVGVHYYVRMGVGFEAYFGLLANVTGGTPIDDTGGETFMPAIPAEPLPLNPYESADGVDKCILPRKTIPIPKTGLNFVCSIRLQLNWGVEAEGFFYAWAIAEAGVIINNGRLSTYTYNNTHICGPEIRGRAWISVGLLLQAEINFLGVLAGSLWVRPRVDAAMGVHARLSVPHDNRTGHRFHECHMCLQGFVDFALDAGFHLGLRVLNFRITLVNRPFPNLIRIRLFDFHFRYDGNAPSGDRWRFALGLCDNFSYRVEIRPYDVNGDILTAGVAAVTFIPDYVSIPNRPLGFMGRGSDPFVYYLKSGAYTVQVTRLGLTPPLPPTPLSFTKTPCDGDPSACSDDCVDFWRYMDNTYLPRSFAVIGARYVAVRPRSKTTELVLYYDDRPLMPGEYIEIEGGIGAVQYLEVRYVNKPPSRGDGAVPCGGGLVTDIVDPSGFSWSSVPANTVSISPAQAHAIVRMTVVRHGRTIVSVEDSNTNGIAEVIVAARPVLLRGMRLEPTHLVMLAGTATTPTTAPLEIIINPIGATWDGIVGWMSTSDIVSISEPGSGLNRTIEVSYWPMPTAGEEIIDEMLVTLTVSIRGYDADNNNRPIMLSDSIYVLVVRQYPVINYHVSPVIVPGYLGGALMGQINLTLETIIIDADFEAALRIPPVPNSDIGRPGSDAARFRAFSVDGGITWRNLHYRRVRERIWIERHAWEDRIFNEETGEFKDGIIDQKQVHLDLGYVVTHFKTRDCTRWTRVNTRNPISDLATELLMERQVYAANLNLDRLLIRNLHLALSTEPAATARDGQMIIFKPILARPRTPAVAINYERYAEEWLHGGWVLTNRPRRGQPLIELIDGIDIGVADDRGRELNHRGFGQFFNTEDVPFRGMPVREIGTDNRGRPRVARSIYFIRTSPTAVVCDEDNQTTIFTAASRARRITAVGAQRPPNYRIRNGYIRVGANTSIISNGDVRNFTTREDVSAAGVTAIWRRATARRPASARQTSFQ